MKHIFIITTLCMAFIASSNAQDADQKLVEETVSYYLDGGTNNDFETLKKAFHDDATMKFIGGDGYKAVNALAFFKKGMKPGPKQKRTTSIEAVDVMGTAATAKLKIKYDTFMFIDYMNLLKIDGQWKIVSKIFYRQNLN
ncbi:nuclear transport factor 2 family protein [Maribacter sp.]|nr:nuclear transport factor 2 family protein [Maribacter sp.]